MPEITQFEVFNARPAGKTGAVVDGGAGVIAHPVTAPPLLSIVGVIFVIVRSLVKINSDEGKDIAGATSLTVMVTATLFDPPLFVAVML